ncbi:hypothetical protein [Photobacterium leiognathi]|uniref:hypothetical protein n=1 Tax=Photobacterium leiognathi TaxID=553611 RepID=UPI00298194BA|nr:hypothetical protein [Photobacterium leiognathi]
MSISLRESKNAYKYTVKTQKWIRMLTDKERSQLQERLVRLYLRLNGYFSDGFIVHNDINGRISSEVDILGVRFPNHSESEREVGLCPRLQLNDSNDIDVLIGEVKSNGVSLRFNNAISANIEVLRKILNRVGAMEREVVDRCIADIHGLFSPKPINSDSVKRILIPESNVQISILLFAPETNNQRNNQNYFITGNDIFTYIWSCFRPENTRESCSVRYDFSAWRDYEDIVRYFKDRDRKRPGSINDLYAFVEQNR